MSSRIVRVSDTIASAIETDVPDHVDDDCADDFDPIRAAWKGRGLEVTSENVGGLIRAVNELSNHCDQLAEDRAISPEERKFYRRASRGLADLLSKVRKAA